MDRYVLLIYYVDESAIKYIIILYYYIVTQTKTFSYLLSCIETVSKNSCVNTYNILWNPFQIPPKKNPKQFPCIIRLPFPF